MNSDFGKNAILIFEPNVFRRKQENLATDKTRNKHGFYERFHESVFYPCFIRGSLSPFVTVESLFVLGKSFEVGFGLIAVTHGDAAHVLS
jgi:hypothetical protein